MKSTRIPTNSEYHCSRCMHPLLQLAILHTHSLRDRENPTFPPQLRLSCPEKATESAGGHCARSAIDGSSHFPGRAFIGPTRCLGSHPKSAGRDRLKSRQREFEILGLVPELRKVAEKIAAGSQVTTAVHGTALSSELPSFLSGEESGNEGGHHIYGSAT